MLLPTYLATSVLVVETSGDKWRHWFIFSNCSIMWNSFSQGEGFWEQQNLILYWTNKSWLISLRAHGRGRKLEDWPRCNQWTERARQQPAAPVLLDDTLPSGVSWWGYTLVSQIFWDKNAGFSGMWVQEALWGNPACKARPWVRSLRQESFYWEMCGFHRQARGRSGTT